MSWMTSPYTRRSRAPRFTQPVAPPQGATPSATPAALNGYANPSPVVTSTVHPLWQPAPVVPSFAPVAYAPGAPSGANTQIGPPKKGHGYANKTGRRAWNKAKMHAHNDKPGKASLFFVLSIATTVTGYGLHYTALGVSTLIRSATKKPT